MEDWSGSFKTGTPTVYLPMECLAKAKVLESSEKHLTIKILELRESPRARQKQIENFEKVLALKDQVTVHFMHFEPYEVDEPENLEKEVPT